MLKKIFLLFSFLFLFSPPAFALAPSELLPANQVINSDFARYGQTVQIDGEIKGDVFLAGGIVTVNGQIDGDLFVLGGKVNINGPVEGSIRVLGGDVTANGPVGRNALIICANGNVTNNSTISGSLIVAGANLEESAGNIGKGFRFFGSRLYLNSDIANEAFVVADKEFLLGPQASISGELKYTGNSQAVLEPGATVAGSILYQPSSSDSSFPRFFGAREALTIFNKIKPITDLFGLIISALIGFVLLGLFPKGFEKVAQAIEKQPYASFGWGLVAIIGIPVVAVLFALTIIGLPVTLVLFILLYLTIMISQYLAAFFIGRKILLPRFGERRGWALLVGLVLLYVLGVIPVLGALVKLVLILLGLGALVLSYRQPEIFKLKPIEHFFESPKRGRPRRLAKGRV